jgi:hypothetical protein
LARKPIAFIRFSEGFMIIPFIEMLWIEHVLSKYKSLGLIPVIKKKKAGSMAQVVEHLPSKHKALSSKPQKEKKLCLSQVEGRAGPILNLGL